MKNKIAFMKQELKDMLKQPLLPAGISRKYFTYNSVLPQLLQKNLEKKKLNNESVNNTDHMFEMLQNEKAQFNDQVKKVKNAQLQNNRKKRKRRYKNRRKKK